MSRLPQRGMLSECSSPVVRSNAGGVLLLPDPVAVRSILGDSRRLSGKRNVLARPTSKCLGAGRQSCSGLARDGLCPCLALGVLPQFQDEAGKAIVPRYTRVRPGSGPWGRRGAWSPRHRWLLASAVGPTPPKVNWRTLLLRTGLCSVSGDFAPVRGRDRLARRGTRSPTPDFELALNALKTSPAECLCTWVTLSRYDVVGAQAAGMTAVHVDPLELCTAADHTHARSLPSFVADLLGTAQS